MRVIQSLLTMVVVGCWALPAAAGTVRSDKIASQYQKNLSLDACQAMSQAAHFLVEAQQPGSDRDAGWAWEVGKGPVSPNVTGLAALALIDAYQASGQKKYLAAARHYGDALRGQQAQWSRARLPYKADLEFLMRLSQVSQDRNYAQSARQGFAIWLQRSAQGADEVRRIRQGRRQAPALLGFDVALGIRAAAALGERSYALALADAVLSDIDTWYRLADQPRYSLVSAAAMVQALRKLDAGIYRAAIDRFQADLLRHQGSNGSWMLNETQPSAYAILALADGNPKERAAYQRGLAWLKSTMLRNGSFASFNDHMPEPFVGSVISEVHAEAVSALSQACKAR